MSLLFGSDVLYNSNEDANLCCADTGMDMSHMIRYGCMDMINLEIWVTDVHQYTGIFISACKLILFTCNTDFEGCMLEKRKKVIRIVSTFCELISRRLFIHLH